MCAGSPTRPRHSGFLSMLTLANWTGYDMEQAIYDHGLAPLDVYLDADRGVVFEAHPALGHIRFTGGYGARLMQDAVVSDAASGLFPYFEGNRYALGAHPILCRSFATFAPTTKMMLRPVAGVAPDRSPEGYRLVRTNALTIYDVVHAIHAEWVSGCLCCC